jgi:hypothetical protein
MNLESGSDACALYDIDVGYCCPTEGEGIPNPIPSPVDGTEFCCPPATTTPGSASTGTTIENQCVICPNGPSTGLDDYLPYANNGDSRTCAQLIQDALNFESGTEDCGLADIASKECCYTPPENPCILCPTGTTIDLDKVPVYSGHPDLLTCSMLSEEALYFESESSYCRWFNPLDQKFCCPSATTTPTTPAPTSPSSTTTPTTPARTTAHATTYLPSNNAVVTPEPVTVERRSGNTSIFPVAISSVAFIVIVVALAVCFLVRIKKKNNTKTDHPLSFSGSSQNGPTSSTTSPVITLSCIDDISTLGDPYIVEVANPTVCRDATVGER